MRRIMSSSKISVVLIGLTLAACAGVNPSKTQSSIPASPVSRVEEVREVIHGVEVADPYRWLEGDTDEVKQWVVDQNQYTRNLLDAFPQRAKIRKRLQELYQIDSVGMPYARGNRYFFRERHGTEDLSILYVQDGLYGMPRVLIDPNTLSRDKTTALYGWEPSRSGKLLSYGLSEAGNDASSLRVMEVDTGRQLPDVIPAELYPSFNEWSLDGSGFWYSRRPPNVPKGEEKYHQKAYYHKLGTDWKDDVFVCCENIEKEDSPWVELSEDGRWLMVTVYIGSKGQRRNEIYLKRANSDEKFTPVVKDIDARFSATIHRDSIYIRTDYQAPLWKLMKADVARINEGIAGWSVVIPEGRFKLNGFKVMRDKLFVETLEDVISRLRLYDLGGRLLKDVELPTLGSLGSMSGEKESDELFFGFSSFLFPYTIYKYDFASDNYAMFKQVNAGINPDDFVVKQAWFSSKDGTRIPMFVMHKRGIKPSGDNPTMLYGYGGFNASLTPYFDKDAIMFLEHGGVYAIANLRGGGEFGEEWHKAGMRENKQNVFDDFIAAAEWLIANNYTNPQRLAIFGWSNGGLLTGASLVQRPDLFAAVVIGAPVLDMVRYHKFFGARYWFNDYGNPDNPNDFKYLYSYSPYHNLKDGVKYPATLILTADSDDRVHPMHAYKMAARLQAANNSAKPILLRVEIKAGHGGATPLYKYLELYTDMWSFVFWQLGMK